jgi:hypothetical protein
MREKVECGVAFSVFAFLVFVFLICFFFLRSGRSGRSGRLAADAARPTDKTPQVFSSIFAAASEHSLEMKSYKFP